MGYGIPFETPLLCLRKPHRTMDPNVCVCLCVEGVEQGTVSELPPLPPNKTSGKYHLDGKPANIQLRLFIFPPIKVQDCFQHEKYNCSDMQRFKSLYCLG